MKYIFSQIIILKLTVVLLLFTQQVFGQDQKIEDLNYPELMVTPKASERLKIESMRESNLDGYWYQQHAPIQISALLTLISSFQLDAKKPFFEDSQTEDIKNTNNAIKVGQIVGASWLALSTYMAFNYRPYTNSYKDIKKFSQKSKKEVLVRERMAEEHIHNIARVGRRLIWSSFVTNLLASAFMAASSKEDASIIAGISALASAAPLFISYNWLDISDSHREYKKKIYGPVAQTGIVIEPSTKKPQLGLLLSYNF